MAVFIILVLILSLVILLLGLVKTTNGKCNSNKRLEGKVVIVTGGTSGIGLEVATDIARRGAKVIVACPFEEEGANVKRIIQNSGNDKVIFKLLDLASLSSIRQFAADIKNSEDKLDILINNAGVGIPVNTKSVNGTNLIMHVNYFGHFLLTILLLPLLKKAGKASEPSRIVNLSSCAHVLGTIDHACKERVDFFYRFQCYCNSKYCLALFAYALSEKLTGSNIVMNAVDPGLVGTRIYESFHYVVGKIIKFILHGFFKTPLEGAQTVLHAALDDEAGRVTGQFFKNCKLARAKKSVYDHRLSKQLWEDSVRIVKLEAGELNDCLN